MQGFFVVLGLGLLTLSAMMLLLWLIHLIIKNAGTVDVGWGLGFIILVLTYGFNFDGFHVRKIILVFLISLWGLRLTLFLIDRMGHEHAEDRRYQTIRQRWGRYRPLKFFFFFQSQAILQMILSLPLIIICLNPSTHISIIEITGIVIFVAGLIGETVADEQLSSFRRNPRNRGKVCERGLWNYSRHPNYFFELVLWIGLFIFALGSPWGFLAIIAPLIMYVLITKISGVPLAEEQALRTRGAAYRQYQETTSVLIPMPKKD